MPRILTDPAEIAERNRLGLDRKDEMWDGAYVMVPPASSSHSDLSQALGTVLRPAAKALGLRGMNEPGVFDPAVQSMTSYRVPDLGFARPEHVTGRGIEGHAALVVEVLSPRDDSYEKLPFYREVGVGELLYADPETGVAEVRTPTADGDDWEVASAQPGEPFHLRSLGITLRVVDGEPEVVD